MTEYELKKDQLVLYFEESSSDLDKDDFSEIRCYIFYDPFEKEYFIAGKKQDESSEDFKFYCKTIKDTYTFLTHLVDNCSKINLSLFNFSNIRNDTNRLDHFGEDYYSLENHSDKEGCEIVAFCDCVDLSSRVNGICDTTDHLYIFLKMLKKVRY